MTNGDALKTMAEKQGVKPRTLEQVKNDIAKAQAFDGGGMMLARLMLKAGRLDVEAAEYVLQYVEQESDASIPVDAARD